MLRAEAVAQITARRNLNPERRHRSYPRVVKRARHNHYRVKKDTDSGVRHAGPPVINLANLKHRPNQRQTTADHSELTLAT